MVRHRLFDVAAILLTLAGAVALYWMHGQLLQAAGPFWLATNSDPEYAYLLNALRVAQLLPPCHIDHPGTPLQLAGAVLLRAQHAWAASPLPLDMYVVTHSEAALRLINQALMAVAVAAYGFLCLKAWFSTRNVALTTCLLSAPFLSPVQLESLRRVSPELVMLPLGLAFIWAVGSRLEGTAAPGGSRRWAVSSGALAAVAFFTKITALPFACVLAAGCESPRERRLFLGGAAAATLLFLLVIRQKLWRMAIWVSGLFLGAGQYGKGQQTIVDTDLFWANLQHMARYYWPVFCLMGVALAVAVWRRRQWRSVCWRLMVALCVAFGLTLAAVAKHYAAHYLFFVFQCSALLLYLILATAGVQRTRLAQATVVLVTVLLIRQTLPAVEAQELQLRSNANATLALLDQVSTVVEQGDIIPSYRASSLPYALSFGNEFSCRSFDALLGQVFPSTFFYSIWEGGEFYSFAGKGREELVQSGRQFVIQGTTIGPDFMVEGQKLGECLGRSEGEAFYRLPPLKEMP